MIKKLSPTIWNVKTIHKKINEIIDEMNRKERLHGQMVKLLEAMTGTDPK